MLRTNSTKNNPSQVSQEYYVTLLQTSALQLSLHSSGASKGHDREREADSSNTTGRSRNISKLLKVSTRHDTYVIALAVIKKEPIPWLKLDSL